MTTSARFDLTDKRALVTGGCQGIGRAIAIGLAEHGADVAVVDRQGPGTAGPVLEAIGQRGRQAWFFQQDLAQTHELADFADRAWREMGRIDVLVNNAGIAFLERFNEITIEHWRKLMAVDLEAVFFLTQRVAEHMIAAGVRGRIINLSSKNGLVAEAGLAHYNAAKGGVELLTQSLAVELGQHGITVNALGPGIIQTDIGADFDVDRAAFMKYYREHIPLEGRFGSVDECVGPVVFLASAASSYMTGQHLVVDGGVLAQQLPRMQFMKPYRNTIESEAQAEPASKESARG